MQLLRTSCLWALPVVVTTIANGLLNSATKERLLFLRWSDVLPDYRAFSVHAKADPRIDFARLQRACGNKVPSDPKEQNSLWYRFYLEMQDVPVVVQVHRDYLLLRDYTGLAALFLIGFGIAALLLVAPWKAFGIYLGILLLIVVRHAAVTFAIRFVCTVLAQKAGKPTASSAAKKPPA